MPRINRQPAERGLDAEAAARRLGGARREGSGWKCRCPAHDDRTPSLHVSDREDGGLLVHCFAPGCTQDRVIDAMRAHGIDVAPPNEFRRARLGQRGGPATNGWTPIMPVPDDAPTPPLEGASATYCYRNAAGKLLFYVARYEARTPEERKRFCPWTFWRAADGRTEWRPKSVPAPRPLYGLELLAARADAPVLVTEGEKAAEAARRIFPEFAVVTSPNGAKAAAQADWSPLTGKQVTIWPDADMQGRDFASEVADLAATAGAASVAVVSVPATWPDGWDLADEPPEGVTASDLQQMVEEAPKAATCGHIDVELPTGATEEIGPAVDASVELDDLGHTQRDVLLAICDDARFWRSHEGETFATVPVEGHFEHWPVGSRTFRDWLLGELARRYRQKGRPASVGANAVRDALGALEARAYACGTKYRASLRAIEHNGEVYIDRGTPDWSSFKVTAAGWCIVPDSPLPILRSKRTGSFPQPAEIADLVPLRDLLRRLDFGDYVLFISWCLGALSPTGPYPILIISGEAGSGKSTIVRLAQRIVDPVAGDVLQPPRDDRDLIAAAKQGRVLAFDNLSGIQPELADSLCRLATGSEIGGRALYSDHDTATFAACRPLIINGIPDLAARGDLADRAIIIRLGPLAGRMTEKEWWQSVEKVLPPTMAALLDALALGLKRLDEVPTPNVRMADFARLIVAAEPALSWDEGSFLAAYAANRKDAIRSLIEGDLVASLTWAFTKEHPRGWTGLKSTLFDILSSRAPPEAKRSRDWPGNPRWFSDRLCRASPALRAVGVLVIERRTADGVEVTITREPTLATAAT